MAPIEILEQQAIEAAMNSEWEQAIEANAAILKEDPENIDAHLRLGYSYLQATKLKEAQKQYKKALKIQPKNNIAIEHLEKIAILSTKKQKKRKKSTKVKYDASLFLEVAGRTKSVRLVNLGKKEDLASRIIGEEVMLKQKKRRLEVRSLDNEYIGTLPDDISKRLLYFIKEKSEYKTYIKETDLTEVIVFIREIEKGRKVKQYPSFPSNPHIMLTDINQSETDDEKESENSDQTKSDDEDTDDEDIDIEDEQWGNIEQTEEKEDLTKYVDVQDDDDEDE